MTEDLRAHLVDILRLPRGENGPLAAMITPVEETDRHVVERVSFRASADEEVPGYLLKPKGVRSPFPVMICLQGHTPGMHISLGRSTNDKERAMIAEGRDIALQAVARGWAALAIEQRAFGVRAKPGVRCNDAALHALHHGWPLAGQRVFDVTRAIDFIATRPELDAARIGCMGNSSGGTVSFYAACVEPRISIAVVSCSFCTFEDSWLSLPHCACGYLPGIGAVADMPELAGLIAPRRLLLVAGREDPLARIEGVEAGYRHARELFAAQGAAQSLRLVVGDGGHHFFPELAWPVIQEMAATLTRRTEDS